MIGVPAETVVRESRVAATPETVKKLKAQGSKTPNDFARPFRPDPPK